MSQKMRILQLHSDDNVMIALSGLASGAEALGVTAKDRIPRGHKVAMCDIALDEPIVKYGQIIGFAKEAIAIGSWVHEHNVYVRPFTRTVGESKPNKQAENYEGLPSTFEGYHRPNGKVGTRNYIAVMTSVNCSATVAKQIAIRMNGSDELKAFSNVDGVIPLVHGTGCGIDIKGEAYDLLKRTQWGYASNPNIGGVLMVGLGCEAFQIPKWMEAYNIKETNTFRSMTIQEVGGTQKTIDRGCEFIREMLPDVNAIERKPAPVSELMLALQCGGSDGLSGVTSNPALGIAVDILVSKGGTAILSETPEIYGAEHLLIARARDVETGDAITDRIKWWEEHTAKHDMEMNNNPSPGNKLGGLSTILEKSLGAIAKSGSTPVEGVYKYAELVDRKGLVFMDTPGYDPVSATGQVAGGANIMCFTTGRGSAFGAKPTPSLKLASNSNIYEHMLEDMDINCGDIIDGVSHAEKGKEIYLTVLEAASGKPTKSEVSGYGDNEFVPWQIGATM